MTRALVLFFFVGLAAACSPNLHLDALKARAASDLKCTEPALTDVNADAAYVYLASCPGTERRGFYELQKGSWEPINR